MRNAARACALTASWRLQAPALHLGLASSHPFKLGVCKLYSLQRLGPAYICSVFRCKLRISASCACNITSFYASLLSTCTQTIT